MNDSDEQAIRDLIAAWMSASKAGDTAKVLSLMTDDVVFLVPGQKPFGKEAFAAASKGMSGAKLEGTSQIEELTITGNWAFTRCRMTVAITPPGGKPMRRSGYTLSVYRKEPDGAWRLARDANLLAPE